MKSNQNEIIEFLKATAGQRNSLVIPRVYIKITGSLEIALFLSQCIYWSDKGKKPGGWFWKTYQEWESELMLSEYMVRKAVRWMRGRKLLETKVKKAQGNPTVHYRVNIFNVWKLLEKVLHSSSSRGRKKCQGGGSLAEEQKFKRGERGNRADTEALCSVTGR